MFQKYSYGTVYCKDVVFNIAVWLFKRKIRKYKNKAGYDKMNDANELHNKQCGEGNIHSTSLKFNSK